MFGKTFTELIIMSPDAGNSTKLLNLCFRPIKDPKIIRFYYHRLIESWSKK